MTDSEVLKALTKVVQDRIIKIGDLGLPSLIEACSEEDRERLRTVPQFRQGTTECYAWHDGYFNALNNIMAMIVNRDGKPVPEDLEEDPTT